MKNSIVFKFKSTCIAIGATAVLFCFTACSKDEPIKIDEITFSSSQEYMVVGDTVSLEVTINPADAAERQIILTSSDENVVRIEEGKMIAVASGTATVTASVTNDSKTAECGVSVANLYYLGWKSSKTPFYSINGVQTEMDFPSEEGDNVMIWTSGRLFVSGNDVYVGGMNAVTIYTEDDRYDIWRGMVWRNGKYTIYKTQYLSGIVNCVYVSGDKVYAGGTFYNGSGEGGNNIAVLWYNGMPLELSTSGDCECIDVFVSGTDVYAVGQMYGTIRRAMLWKNGKLVELNDNEGSTSGTSVFVDASGNVYVSGSKSVSDGAYARVWKNGEPIDLTKGAASARAQQCRAYGSGVIAAGYVCPESSFKRIVTFWKDKESLSLTDGNNFVDNIQFSVFGNKAYVYGKINNVASRLWVINIDTMTLLKTIDLPMSESIQSVLVQ